MSEKLYAEVLPSEYIGRKGDYIQTYTGSHFWPHDPKPSEIHILDIAHALSQQCRFSGHLSEFYSVGQHCIEVANLLPKELQLWGLLHDASEAYLIDLPSPTKRGNSLGDLFREVEDGITTAIALKYNLPKEFAKSREVKEADEQMLISEARSFFLTEPTWLRAAQQGSGKFWTYPLTPLAPKEVEMEFLRKFKEYGGR